MTVTPGTRLGPYEITSRIGAGGMGEVFRAKDVEPFPRNGSQWQISTGDGYAPVWGRDGKALYFVAEDGQLMETAITTQNGFTAGTSRPLFGVRLRENVINIAQYDVAPDGAFILNAIPDHASFPMTLVVNWREALAR